MLGVLLLNAVLTVRAHQATSHKEKGWEQFTDVVVSWLNKNLDGVVFMLWGAYAQKKGSSIDRVQIIPVSLEAFYFFWSVEWWTLEGSFLTELSFSPCLNSAVKLNCIFVLGWSLPELSNKSGASVTSCYEKSFKLMTQTGNF